ncbi:MAG: AMP-binding protein [Pseudomonadales bacterium]
MTGSISGKGEPPWQTIPAMLAENLIHFANKTAIADGDTRISYAELSHQLQRAACGLAAQGLGPGDVVAIWAPNSWQWVVSALACWWRGCIVTPIAARGKILDAMPALKATDAKLLFTCSNSGGSNLVELISAHLTETGQSLASKLPKLQSIVDLSGDYQHPELPIIGWNHFAGTEPTSEQLAPANITGDDLCEILFTSGSTGTPKGVLRQHHQVIRDRWSSSLRRGFKDQDIILALSPFSHTLGLNGTLLRSLIMGCTLVIAKNSNPKTLSALIRDENITAMSGPPSLFTSLLQEKTEGLSVLSNLRLTSVGSATIPVDLVRNLFSAGVDSVVSGYGMTECDSIASATATESIETIATTVGKPEEGFEVQIVDDAGNTVDRGDAGEIWIKSYSVTPGYLNAPEQTALTINADGWLKSGDIGRWTDKGYLQILGRKKDVITIHGYTLYPAEIEKLLTQSGILKEIAVLGIPHQLAGEICVAYIVPQHPEEFTVGQLRHWALRHIADYKIPTRLIIVAALPLNHNNKVDRMKLKEMLNE